MSFENNLVDLPRYQDFVDKIAILSLPMSSSELHGVICGYLCAGEAQKAETYIRALTLKSKKDELTRAAACAIFDTYAITQQQLDTLDFTFQLLLPSDDAPLAERAKAFSQWCEGFAQGITLSGVNYELLDDEESREALQHIVEFAELDYDSLNVSDDDERALIDISEYTRMAVLRLSQDFSNSTRTGTKH